tara:strand:+ start:12 stop:290 length:279 start_codon:yes stop_codon:yes gene_type:complete
MYYYIGTEATNRDKIMRIEIEKAGIIWIAGKVSEESKIQETIKKLAGELGEDLTIMMDESDEDGIDLSIMYDAQFTTIAQVKKAYLTIKKAA